MVVKGVRGAGVRKEGIEMRRGEREGGEGNEGVREKERRRGMSGAVKKI